MGAAQPRSQDRPEHRRPAPPAHGPPTQPATSAPSRHADGLSRKGSHHLPPTRGGWCCSLPDPKPQRKPLPVLPAERSRPDTMRTPSQLQGLEHARHRHPVRRVCTMASHTNTRAARPELTTVITIDDALLLFQPGAQQLLRGSRPECAARVVVHLHRRHTCPPRSIDTALE